MALSQTIARLAQIKAAIRAALEEKLLRDPGARFADYAPLIRNFWKPELNLSDTETLQAIVSGETVTFKFSQTEAGGVAVDWGDGTAVETSDATGEVTLSHTYEYPTARHKIQARVVAGEATVAAVAFGNDPAVYELALVQAFGYAAGAFGSVHKLQRVALIGGWNIPENCFSYCNKLRELVLHDEEGSGVGSIRAVGRGAFLNTPLWDLRLSVKAGRDYDFKTRIGMEAFRNSSLVGISAGEPEELGQSAFSGCKYLTYFAVSRAGGIGYLGTITSIPAWCFQDCISLIQANIPESVQMIEGSAFKNCWSLMEIDLPAAVNYIGDSAFYGCISLWKVTVRATTPPRLDYPAVTFPANLREIRVPAESVEAYKAATNWSAFADRIFAIEE